MDSMQMHQDEELLFFDIEVFSHDAFVVFKDINKKLKRVFHNNFVQLESFIQGKILVGFNNYYYDDKILTYMLDLRTPQQIKALNDRIISGEEVNILKKKHFKSLDCFQQLDVSKPSLKKIEGNMGRMILESSVPFTINRPLAADEFDNVLHYCIYDVDTTIDIYKHRINSYFKPKISLVGMLKNDKAIKWNTTTISANLLLEKPLRKWADIRIEEWMMQLVPPEVKEFWLEESRKREPKGSVTFHDFNNIIQFAFGGLHGAHRSIKRAEKVKLLDVTSMYPNIILILNVLGSASEKYRRILLERIKVKHQDPILSDALKLILNSVYGNLNSKYSMLHNQKALLSVCLYGQIALYDLCKRIAPYAEILNINTDGVAFIPEHEGYVEAYKEWEQDFKLQLEEKNFDLWVQKDVNNYIAIKDNGKMECKGGDVNRYHKDAFFKNNNARILDIALVEKLVNGKDITETLMENLDKPHLYQYILKAGNTYQGTCKENGQLLETKVNRVFAAKQGGCLYKLRHDNGIVRFADAPMNMFMWNQDCADLEGFEKIVDLNHYYQILIKRLERWN
jgi:hypothetical protein